MGLFEHARGTVPDPRHGYCTDDVARALVVVLREPVPPSREHDLEGLYLAFLTRMARPDGHFRNRMSAAPACRLLDRVGSDDASGRAIWALGATAAHGSSPARRRRALSLFTLGAHGFTSPWPRSNAAAALGAVEALTVDADHRPARGLLERAVAGLGAASGATGWPWPEPRLGYDNARLADARIAAGVALADDRLLREGLALLEWLVVTETRGDHFSFTPQQGWAPGEPRPGFDQQPIEAGAMADACARAFATTGDRAWADACLQAARWYLGANDCGLPLLDPDSGGCRDGLGPGGASANQGAESTIALISALQQARLVQAAERSAASSCSPSRVAAPT